MVKFELQCEDCLATLQIHHDLDDENMYTDIRHCPYCGSEDIEVEELEDD